MYNRKLVIDALVYVNKKSYGYQEYLFNLLDFFHSNRNDLFFDQIIIVCDETQVSDFEKYKNKFIIQGYHTPNLIIRFFIQILFPFFLKVKKNDIVLWTANYSSLIKLSKNVLVIHDLLYLRKHLLPNRSMRIQRGFYIPRSIKLADKIVAISDFTKSDILTNFGFSKQDTIQRIYNYFNFEKYASSNNEIINPPLYEYFLCVSSTAYHKNVITIIKAFENYCKYESNRLLYIVGGLGNNQAGNYFTSLSEDIKQRIVFLKNLSNAELGVYFQNSTAYISASYFEGLGMPIVEAMYFNTALIISDLEVHREITENNAIYFNPNCFEELSDRMIKFAKKSENTKSFVLDKFSNDNTSNQYIKLLNSI